MEGKVEENVEDEIKSEIDKNTVEGKLKKDNKGLLETIIDIVADFIQAFIIVFILTNFVLINANVPTSSMNDTIPTGARLFASRLHTALGEIKRGDVIIFKYPDNNNTIYVKRTIGLPGDTIEGKDGEVYVNGEKLEEPYIKAKINSNFGPYTVPENSYFMLGDNRNNSRDSRYWNDTFVTRDEIMGKAIIQYYPEIKLIK